MGGGNVPRGKRRKASSTPRKSAAQKIQAQIYGSYGVEMVLYLKSNCLEYSGIGDCDNVEESYYFNYNSIDEVIRYSCRGKVDEADV